MLVLTSSISAQEITGLLIKSENKQIRPSKAFNRVSDIEELNTILKDYVLIEYKPVLDNPRTEQLGNIMEIKLSNSQNYLDLINRLRELSIIIWVQPEYIYQTACNIPYDDTLATGNEGYYLEAMNIPCAWEVTKGDANTIVAVVDEYFDFGNEDMQEKFHSIQGNCLPEKSFCSHGFATAGTVSAIVNNGQCTVGSGYNTRVAGYCAPAGEGCGFIAGASAQMCHALNDGHKILSLSFGHGASVFSGFEEDFIQYFIDAGVVVVHATRGTDNSSALHIPGYLNIGQVDQSLNYIPYNGVEINVDLYAACINVPRLQALNTCNIGTGNTSFGTPTVAGIVALMRSINPCLTPADIEYILETTVSGLPANAAQYPEVTNGIMDAYAAVLEAQSFTGVDKLYTAGSYVESVNQTISGDMILEAGAEVTVTSTMLFSSDSRILVKRGARLIVDGGVLDIDPNTCNGTKWKGINIEGNSVNPNDPDDFGKEFIVQPNDPFANLLPEQCGVLVLINEAKIMNCHFSAVFMGNRQTTWPEYNDYHGGLIYADHAHFINNGRGIAFMKYDNGGVQDKSVIKNCTFTDGKVGVSNWSSDGIQIEDNTFTRMSRYAINTIDGSYNIYNHNVFDPQITVSTTGVNSGIYINQTYPNLYANQIGNYNFAPNEFVGGDKGIWMNATNDLEETKIINNNFLGCYTGVRIDALSSFQVINSTFDSNVLSCIIFDTGTKIGGESTDNNNNNLFEDNLIENHRGGLYTASSNFQLQVTKNCFHHGGSVYSRRDWILTALHNSTFRLPNQGDLYTAATNCFSHNGNASVHLLKTGYNTFEPFNYMLIKGSTPELCEEPYNSTGQMIDQTFVINKVSFHDHLDVNCGSSGIGQPPPQDEFCKVSDSLTIGALVSIMNEVEDAKDNLDTLDILYEFENRRFAQCLKKIKAILIKKWTESNNTIKIVELYNGDPTFSTGILVFGALMNIGAYDQAKSFVAELNTTNLDQQNFIDVQLINIRRLREGLAFKMTVQDSTILNDVGYTIHPLSGYARSVWFAITGKHIDFDFPGFDRSTPRSIKKDLVDNNVLTIYPNPSSDFIFMDFSKIVNVASWSITSINGTEMLKETFESGIDNETVDISSLPTGLYLVRVITSEGVTYTNKLVKTKL